MGEREEKFWLILGAACLVILLGLTILVTANDDATELEKGLLQFILFVASIVIAVVLGRQSAKAGAREIVRPHGRKAVRRIVTLGSGVQSFGGLIETERELVRHRADADEQIAVFEVERTFDVLNSHIDGQLRTIADAIEDWRDVVPDEVAAIEERAERSRVDDKRAN